MSFVSLVTGYASLPFLEPYFDRPELLYIIIPLLLLVFLITKRSKCAADTDKREFTRQRRLARLIFIMRSLLCIVLVVALAGPAIRLETQERGSAFLKVFVDNSTSMELFDLSPADGLLEGLEDLTSLEVLSIGHSGRIGDDLLSGVAPGQEVLLISDGNAYAGLGLGDVLAHMARLNVTLNALSLEPSAQDFSVDITGPSKLLEDVETEFTLTVTSALRGEGEGQAARVAVLVDDELLFTEEVDGVKVFSDEFEEGTHTISARVEVDDHFSQNNEFYKTITVVKKPRLFLFSQRESPLEDLLERFYKVDWADALPESLDAYQVVVVNDIPSRLLEVEDLDALSDFALDEKGLLFIGGKSSFDRGGYKDSQVEDLLPVFVSGADRQEGDTNVVLAIDISGSSAQGFGDTSKIDVEKSLAVGAYDDLSFDAKVGLVAFNHKSYLVAPMEYKVDQEGIQTRIASLNHSGATRIDRAIVHAVELLENTLGSKNIILISDGHSHAPLAAKAAELASQKGVKIYTVGVGRKTDEDNLKAIARLTGGVYFAADHSSRLRLLFGDPEEGEGEDGGEPSAVVIDYDHFITRGFDPDAKILGFNEVVPKDTASLLMTTSQGYPLLTVWRYGLGKVAAFTSDDGLFYAGDMLGPRNSAALLRTINWLVGDPLKALEEYVFAQDTVVGEPASVQVRSKREPDTELALFALGDGEYLLEAPAKSTGLSEVLGTSYAVNYPLEFYRTGFNEGLEEVVRASGGRVFEADDRDGVFEEVRSYRQRSLIETQRVTWPLLAFAIVLFLLDLTVRRMFRR